MTRALRSTLAVLAVFAVACDGTPSAPEGPALHLEVVEGDGQEGLEGLPLPGPVRLRVVDATGAPLPGASVSFTASDGGTVRPDDAIAGSTGLVTATWTPGPATAPLQTLRVTPDGDGDPLAVTARVLPEEEGDLVIVRGARGPTKGIVLLGAGIVRVGILAQVATQDTLIRLQPRSDRTELVVFPTADAVEWRDVQWTAAPDTVVVEMRPPVAVDFTVRIYVAPFEEMRAVAEKNLADAAAVWAKRGMGIRLGEVEYLDRVEPGRFFAAQVGVPCETPARERVEVNYFHTVRGSAAAGEACTPGQVFMGATGGQQYPLLLAHEIGHAFSLSHRVPGLMDPRNSTDGVTEGEIFQANFDERSGLNVLFGAQPREARKHCIITLNPCLEATFRLAGG